MDILEEITNPNTSQERIRSFINHESTFVRYHVASYIKSEVDLETLSKDSEWQVRTHVAINDSTSVKTLIALAEDKDFTVRNHAVRNKNMTEEALKYIIANSKHEEIYQLARVVLNSCLE